MKLGIVDTPLQKTIFIEGKKTLTKSVALKYSYAFHVIIQYSLASENEKGKLMERWRKDKTIH